jgi:dienelactone hydrolase
MNPRAALITMLLALLAPGLATAQEEIPPPSGKGRVVVVLSGATGSGNYRAIATRIAALGYNVVLYDTPALAAVAKNRSRDEVGNAVIAQARQMPHSLPGKVGWWASPWAEARRSPRAP